MSQTRLADSLMGRGAMTKEIDLSRLAGLRQEKPATLMGLIRLAWPDIEAALACGHTLKTVHERLNEGGIEIGYRRLSLYLGRLRRKGAVGEARRPPSRPKRDPLANVRDRTQRRPGFQFDDQPADESKLI